MIATAKKALEYRVFRGRHKQWTYEIRDAETQTLIERRDLTVGSQSAALAAAKTACKELRDSMTSHETAQWRRYT